MQPFLKQGSHRLGSSHLERMFPSPSLPTWASQFRMIAEIFESESATCSV